MFVTVVSSVPTQDCNLSTLTEHGYASFRGYCFTCFTYNNRGMRGPGVSEQIWLLARL